MSGFKLELLRQGDSHNQLLSPITPYLALCENDPATALQVRHAHAQWLHKLRLLNYHNEEVDRRNAIIDVATELSQLWTQIPGMFSQLGNFQSAGSRSHVRLVLSAAELALLPFELAAVPNAVSGEFVPMLLAPQHIALTRESRRRITRAYRPPEKPKVLFAYAEPQLPVPAKAHAKAILDSLDPWRKNNEPSSIAESLRLLPNASIESLSALCRAEAFTHIHLLAHGAEQDSGIDRRFGLALHGSDGGLDIASAERLATAMCGGKSATSLQVISLASCQGGQQGGVIGVGGSIAQALHAAGVPMVLASQFPLTVAGSIRIVQSLFEGLMWGADPRWLVCDIRRELFSQFPQNHDWASLVHYFSGTDVDAEVLKNRIKRAMECANIAGDSDQLSDLERAIKQFEALLSNEVLNEKDAAKVCRRLASTHQLCADLLCRRGLSESDPMRQRVLQELQKAKERYAEASEKYRDIRWSSLLGECLDKVLSSIRNQPDLRQVERAKACTIYADLLRADAHGDAEKRTWALTDEINLCLVLSMEANADMATLIQRASQAARELRKLPEKARFPWFSARRQSNRFVNVYGLLAQAFGQAQAFDNASKIVAAINEILPEIPRPPYEGY